MKTLVWMVIMMVGLWGSAETRAPAVAGSFYPANARELQKQVDSLLDKASENDGRARALVVPHAGYVFSGATAAQGFAAIKGERISRVVLLGPSHHASFSGGALPNKAVTAFGTPLGEVRLDTAFLDELRRSRFFDGPYRAHDREHCLEVELPFLQTVAPGVKIVPILVGHSTDRRMTQAMARELSTLIDASTVVVVSTDFSHHGSGFGWAPHAGSPTIGKELVDLARKTAERAADIDPLGFWQQVEVSGDTVCGKRPVGILTELLAHGFEGSGTVLDVTTSGQVTGSFDQSVSYVSISYAGKWTDWRESSENPELGTLSDAEKGAILDLARASFRTHLKHDASLAEFFDEHEMTANLRAKAGAFVTVHNTGLKAKTEGRLRACMGVIEARKPLVEAVISSAVSAAHDPRFPELTAAELEASHLEVSVLSPTRVVDGFEDIEIGKHGIVLSKRGRSAVFLPQVATEQGWDLDTTLSHLARKAGLSRDDWKRGASFEVFTAQVFAEEE